MERIDAHCCAFPVSVREDHLGSQRRIVMARLSILALGCVAGWLALPCLGQPGPTFSACEQAERALAVSTTESVVSVLDDKKADDTTKQPDVIYVPTPQEVVDKMLELAEVKKGDVVYDLGCGDGRIVVTAAKKFGCKAIGYDIDPERIKESLANVKKEGVSDLVKIEQKDIFKLDLSGANVITLYLLPSLNVKLIPQLEKLKPGSRIVSHAFDMQGVKPKKVVRVTCKDGTDRTVYLWVTPLEKER
jgi:precorrin-6B methylase 2